MDQLPLENFENSRIELLVCQKSLIVSFVKSWPLVGRIDYGKISYCLFCQKLASCGEKG
jgi:hypothetical protein